MVSPHLEAMQEPIKSCLIIGKDVSITQEVLSNLGALCQKLEAQTSVFIYFFSMVSYPRNHRRMQCCDTFVLCIFCGYPVFPGPCVEKTGFSSLNGFGTLVKNHLTIYVLVVICSPSGFSVHGIFQAGILEWVPISCSGRLPDPGIKPTSPESPAL